MSDVKQFKLPDVGEGLTEADIVKWHVRPGDHVEVNQTIVEIETAKAIVELPCPYEGVVTALHADEGQTVDVGVPIISVDVSGDAPGGEPAAAPVGATGAAATVSGEAETEPQVPPAVRDTALNENLVPSPAADPGTHFGPDIGPETPSAPGGSEGSEGSSGSGEPPKRTPVLVGYGVKPGTTKRRPRKRPPATSPAGRPQPVDRTGAGAGGGSGGAGAGGGGGAGAEGVGAGVRVLAKPPVRKMARELGVDLAVLTGSGPEGSITRQDVLAAAGTPVPAQHRPPAGIPSPVMPMGGTPSAAVEAEEQRQRLREPREEDQGEELRIPVKGVRKQTAAAMVASAFTAPHVTEFLQVDATETMRAVRRLRELPDFAEVKVSPLLLVARALLLAVRRNPMINATWADDEIIVRRNVNLGIAAATERGLIVPNIKNAQDLSFVDLATSLKALAETARTGRTPLADLTGGTISITNVGVFGVDTGTPILMPGEAAILAFGQIRDMPWVHNGKIKVRKVTTLALSFDHRMVDGELGSAVLRDVGAALEDPLRMIAWS